MNITSKTMLGLAAAAMIGGIGSQLLDGKEEVKDDKVAGVEPPIRIEDPKDSRDINSLSAKEANFVYDQKQDDGGHRPVLVMPDGTSAIINDYPCAWRPQGVAANRCTYVDGGDPGAENTMTRGTFAGAGCVKKACVIIWGEEEDSQGRVK